MFNFKPERIKFNQIVGSGASGTVYVYQKDPEDKRSVVKNITTRNTKDALKSIQEIVLGFSCENQYVLPVTGYYIDYNETKMLWDVYIKLPRMQNSLKSVLMTCKKDKEQLSEEKIAQYSYAVTLGLQYLHNRKIAHRDIKPENILLDENGRVKIADFGLGHFMGDNTSCNVVERSGSLFYVAPENQDENVQLDNKKLLQADLWSLGMLMLELCILDVRSLDWSLVGKSKEAYLAKTIKGLSGKYSKKLLNIIMRLLRYAPSERLNLRDIQRELEQNYAGVLEVEKKHKTLQIDFPKLESSEDKKLLGHIQELENELTKMKKNYQATPTPEERKKNSNKSKGQSHFENVEIWTKKFQEKWKEHFEIETLKKGIALRFDNKRELSNDITMAFLMEVNELNLDSNKESLKSLQINLRSWRSEKINALIEDIAIVGISSKQENLLHFMLHASSDQQMVNDDAIKKLAVSIGANMPNLQTLSLKFSSVGETGTHQITDKAIKAIAKRIIPCSKKITDLVLGFQGCYGIGDEGLAKLASQLISSLKGLAGLHLDFSRCDQEKMTDKGVLVFASQLGPNLQRLEKLTLDFRIQNKHSRMGQRSSKTIAAMLEHFKHVPNKTIQ